MKYVLAVLAISTLALAGCAKPGAPSQTFDVTAQPSGQEIEITGEATTSMTTTPMVPTDPNVSVYSLEGPVENPFTEDRTHSVLDNTTAGGYTVFDESVKVYPLPGDTAPEYMPVYAVPPLEGQYKPEAPHVGEPIGLASAGMLPPVPSVEIPAANPYAKPPVPGMLTRAEIPADAPRAPLMLTAPEPVTMQPPSQVRPPMESPFAAQDDVPVADAAPQPVMPAAPAASGSGMSAGRRSGPMLTGY